MAQDLGFQVAQLRDDTAWYHEMHTVEAARINRLGTPEVPM